MFIAVLIHALVAKSVDSVLALFFVYPLWNVDRVIVVLIPALVANFVNSVSAFVLCLSSVGCWCGLLVRVVGVGRWCGLLVGVVGVGCSWMLLAWVTFWCGLLVWVLVRILSVS